MHSVDLLLFSWLGAGHVAKPWLLSIALHVSTVASWLIAVLVISVALRGRASIVRVIVIVGLASIAGLLAHALANALNTPRPFMLGLSPDFAMHSGRGGMPSTHASVMFAVASFMLWHAPTRTAGAAVAALALVTGLARIYLGVHFPFDVLGGFALGGLIGCSAAAIAPLPVIARMTSQTRKPFA